MSELPQIFHQNEYCSQDIDDFVLNYTTTTPQPKLTHCFEDLNDTIRVEPNFDCLVEFIKTFMETTNITTMYTNRYNLRPRRQIKRV